MRHIALVLRDFHYNSHTIHRQDVRVKRQHEHTIHGRSSSFLNVKANLTRRFKYVLRSMIHADNATNFGLVSHNLRATRVDNRVTSGLKVIVVVFVVPIMVRVVPSIVQFITNRFRWPSASQFKAKLEAPVNVRHTVGRIIRHNLRHTRPLNLVH